MPDPTPHSPTDDSRRQVSTMVAFGIPQDKIAVIIGISAPTMRNHYREVINVAEPPHRLQRVAQQFYWSNGLVRQLCGSWFLSFEQLPKPKLMGIATKCIGRFEWQEEQFSEHAKHRTCTF